MPALNIAFDIPQNPAFDVDDFSRKLKDYASRLIANVTYSREEAKKEDELVEVVSSNILTHSVSVEEARRQVLDMVHQHFHPSVTI